VPGLTTSSVDECSTSGRDSSSLQFNIFSMSSAPSWWPAKQRHAVLASLTSSSKAAATAQRSVLAAHMPPPWLRWLVGLKLPSVFLQEQRTAATVLAFHRGRGEEFPRPCPHCSSCQFMVDAQGKPAGDDSSMVFESRPWSCDQCQRWWHLRCLGVHAVDDVPAKPWHHCSSCRRTFLKLEAQALRGEQPAWELGPAAAEYSTSLVTDTDHRIFLQCAADYLKEDSGEGSEDEAAVAAGARIAPSKVARIPNVIKLRGSPLGQVYELLGEAFPSALLVGFGNPIAEYAGGKYALLLSYKSQPVATCTFDVYGPHAAQLHLLTTAEESRGQGHAGALVGVLESKLEQLGVQKLLVQPREQWLELFEGMGFEVLHPADVALLHMQVPLAYSDAAVMSKALQPKW